MAITSLDILNLSHSLKDICEVNCNTPECLSQTLKILLQYNLIQANLQFGRQLAQTDAPRPCAPHPKVLSSDTAPCHSRPEGFSPDAAPCPPPKPPVRLDIGDPFLDDYEG